MVHVADAFDMNIPPVENDDYIAAVKVIRDEWQPKLAEEMREIRERGQDAS